jgi:gliding motility-associated-like protein
VEVKDAAPPVFNNCPGNIERVVASGSCTAVVPWNAPTATDNCSVGSPVSDHNPSDPFPIGVTLVTYKATDGAGNVATCQFEVKVRNGEALQWADCPGNISAKADESGKAIVTWIEPTISLQCETVTPTSTHYPGDEFDVGDTQVVYSAMDSEGRSATCSFVVSVSYEDIEIGVAQLVTPNGDGVHDTWELANIEKYANNKVVIVDRWGGVVYQATGYDNEQVVWRGANTRGGTVPSGTYFYTLEVRSAGGLTERKGFIEVVQ